jgi:transposase
MGYIQGEGRNQGTLFPVVLDDFVPAHHVCRVIDAFVELLVMSELGFDLRQRQCRARRFQSVDDQWSCLSLRPNDYESDVSPKGR